jgi:hypothetical protein
MIGFSEIRENSDEATDEYVSELNDDLSKERNKNNKLVRELRKVLFALWMTRANYCRSFNVSEYFMNHTTTRNFREFSLKLEVAAEKCREKADKYDDRPPEEKLKKPDIMWTFKERK